MDVMFRMFRPLLMHKKTRTDHVGWCVTFGFIKTVVRWLPKLQNLHEPS